MLSAALGGGSSIPTTRARRHSFRQRPGPSFWNAHHLKAVGACAGALRPSRNLSYARGNRDKLIDVYIDAINNSIEDRPHNMTVCVHLCRGNYAQGMADGGYEPIAERMFDRLDVDGYFLEYDTPRAGDFSPLRHLPKPKKAVLGLVSTKVPELETVDALKRRIDEATSSSTWNAYVCPPNVGLQVFQHARVAVFRWTSLSESWLALSRWRSRSGIELASAVGLPQNLVCS